MARKTKTTNPDISFQLYLNEKRDFPNISIYEAGWERCSPTHNFGPIKRDFYLFHFVVDGAGEYHTGGKSYAVNKGQMFLIVPGEEHQYFSNPKNPWEYYWIGFHGSDAKNVLFEAGLIDKRVFKIKSFDKTLSIFQSIKEKEKEGSSSTFFLIGKFYELMSIIMDEQRIKSDYQNPDGGLVLSVIKYINSHFEQNLTINEIAKSFNINRSHLFRLFKAKMNISIHEYLSNIRMTNALLLLKKEHYSIKQVSEMVGFQDYPNFLKQFKKKYGVTPKSYRSDPFETEHK